MNNSELIMSVIAGIALSACCGFRVFIPLLIATFGIRFGLMPPTWLAEPTLHLIRSDILTAALTIATVLEIVAYKIPYLDNLLDTAATPLAVVAATLLSSSFFTFADEPYIRFVLGAVTGGVGAGIIQTSTSAIRLGSTKFTAGLGNPLFALVETLVAFIGSLVAVLLPLVGITFIILCCWGFIILFKRIYKRRGAGE